MTDNLSTAAAPGAIPEQPDAARGRRFAVLAFGEAFSRLISFGITIYLARVLGASGYGVIALATAVLLYLNFVTDAGLEMLGVRDIAERPERITELLPSLVSARLLIALALVVLTVLVGLAWMPQPEGAVLAAYAVSLGTVAAGTRWVHLGLERPSRVAISVVAGAILSAILILALVHDTGDLARWPVLQLAGDALTVLLLLAFLRTAGHALKVGLDWSVVMPVFRRSWPLMMHALLGLVIFNIDFVFLRIYRDSATVGLYAAAYTLISFFLNLGVAFAMTLLPAMTRLVGAGEPERQLYGRAMGEALAGSLPVAVGGWLLGGSLLAFLFGHAFAPASTPLLILLGSLPIALVRNVAQSALIARGRQDDVLQSVIRAAMVNVVLNFLLIPKYGMIGAAGATLATEFVRTVISLVYVNRAGLTAPRIAGYWRIVVSCLAMAGAVYLVPNLGVWLRVALGVLVYAAGLLATGAIRFGPNRRIDVRF